MSDIKKLISEVCLSNSLSAALSFCQMSLTVTAFVWTSLLKIPEVKNFKFEK